MTLSTLAGALPTDWDFFTDIPPLCQRLLPIAAGQKSPSFWYPPEHKGFMGWPTHETTWQEIDTWQAEPMHNIGLRLGQTIAALDVDTLDRNLAVKAWSVIHRVLGFTPPLRRRTNSFKGATIFYCPIEGTSYDCYQSIALPTAGKESQGIEWLPQGHQIVLAGDNGKGRYEWLWGRFTDFVELTIAQLNALFKALAEAFGPWNKSAYKGAKPLDKECFDDWRIEELLEPERFYYDNGDKIFLPCPNMDDHSGKNAETDFCYMRKYRKANGELEPGQYKCFHNNTCGHIKTKDWDELLKLTGINDDDFVPEQIDDYSIVKELQRALVSCTDVKARPKLIKQVFTTLSLADFSAGFAKLHPKNIQVGLRSLIDVRYDTFAQNLEYKYRYQSDYKALDNSTLTELEVELNKLGFSTKGPLVFNEMVLMGKENSYDSAHDWVNTHKWDGVDRVSTFFSDYFHLPQTSYLKAVSQYFWTALAGRAHERNVKADAMIVLYGQEGTYKTTFSAAITGRIDWHSNTVFNDPDILRDVRGRLTNELEELFVDRRTINPLKRLTSSPSQKHRELYQKFKEDVFFRNVFIATTNEEEFLTPEGEHRRFYPIPINQPIDIEGFKQVRSLLWGQGLAMFKNNGNKVLYKEVEELSKAERNKHRLRTEEDNHIDDFLGATYQLGSVISSEAIYDHLTHKMKPRHPNARNIKAAMNNRGWVAGRYLFEEGRARGYQLVTTPLVDDAELD